MPGTRLAARCATLLGLAQATADDPSLVSASLVAHWLRHTRKASFERGEAIKARAGVRSGRGPDPKRREEACLGTLLIFAESCTCPDLAPRVWSYFCHACFCILTYTWLETLQETRIRFEVQARLEKGIVCAERFLSYLFCIEVE
jgi:hypothetical protein